MTKKERDEEKKSTSVIILFHKKDDYVNNANTQPSFDGKYLQTQTTTHHLSFKTGSSAEYIKLILREEQLLEDVKVSTLIRKQESSKKIHRHF